MAEKFQIEVRSVVGFFESCFWEIERLSQRRLTEND